MIKQITLKNFYNFKKEITIDFTNNNKSKIIKSYVFNKSSISNFSLLYGKNNVGKSNLLKAIKESIKFIQSGKMKFIPFKPNNDETSLFEIIIENFKNEIRYGFEIDIANAKIIDEWLYGKVNFSPIETKFFERMDNHLNQRFFNASVRNQINEVKDSSLYLTYFNNLKNKNGLIDNLLNELNKVIFVSCFPLENQSNTNNTINQIMSINKNDKSLNILNSFLANADLDIVEIKVNKLSDEESKIINKIKLILTLNNKDEKDRELEKLVNKHGDLLKSLLIKGVVGTFSTEDKDVFTLDFVHKSGSFFNYEDLSSGTKQIIGTVLTIIANFEKKPVFFIDEIEVGLHTELVELLLRFFNLVVEAFPTTQFIITTHREELLDLDFISNQNKVFLKPTEKLGEIEISYLSQYKLREYHIPSKRYKLDAFNINPKTYYEYSLIQAFQDLKNKDTDTWLVNEE